MAGMFCDGRTNAIRDSSQGRGNHGLVVPRFGISRKTGYKILDRYEQCGVKGLSDRARRPHRYANQLPVPVELPSWLPNEKTPLGSTQDTRTPCSDGCLQK
jgi:hypothetical protein